MSEEVSDLKDEIVNNFLEHVGEAKDKFTNMDMNLLKELAADSAKLYYKSLTGDKSVEQEIKIVNASLLNLSIATYFPVKNIFWLSVQLAGTILLSALIKAALAAI